MGGVTGLTSLLPDQSRLVVAATTLAVAALFNPVRRRVQGWVDRRFNRSRYDTQRVMDRFAGIIAGPGRQRRSSPGLGRCRVRDHAAADGFGVGEGVRAPARWVVVVWVLLMLAAAVIWLVISWESTGADAGVMGAAVCSVVVGGILTLRVSSNSVGPVALVAGSAWVIYLFGNVYASASLQGPSLPGAYFFGWAGAWTGALFAIGVSTLILVFPTGRPVGWWRVVAIGPIAGMASTLVGAIAVWGLPLSTLVNTDLSSQAPGYGFVDAGFITGFVSAIPATVSLVARFRRAETVERQQVKWLLTATSLFALTYVFAVFTDDSNETLWWIVSAAMAGIPIAILFAVLRYRLYQIDRIVSRTVSYALVVGLLAAVFLGAVTLLTSIVPDESDLATAVSTLAVVGLFTPVRKRVQTWVERRFDRSRYDAQRVIEQFAGSLQGEVDPIEVVDGWVSVVSRTMHPAVVGVWTKDSLRNDFGTIEE